MIKSIDFFASMPMLVAVSALITSDVARLLVPSPHDPEFAPDDPSSADSNLGLWQSEGLEITERGHLPRIEKIRRLTASEVAMRHLRVFWD